MPEEQPQNEFKYWAFISYSHADSSWADWLHKGLETYSVPKNLTGKPSRNGIVPKRAFPVFRDRDELPGSANLGDNLTRALQQSRYLVVICSPKSAKSQWVDQEIRIFKSMGREDRVLCLIVDGEPNVTDRPQLGLEECFPEAVRFWVDADRRITTVPTEPIAADARKGKDGKNNAKLKLLSGILGVDFDALKQRDHERQQRRMQLVLAGAVALIMIFMVLGFQLYRQEQAATRSAKEAVNQRELADRARKNAERAMREAVASEKVALAANEAERKAKEAALISQKAAEASNAQAHAEREKAITARNEAVESALKAKQAEDTAREAQREEAKAKEAAIESGKQARRTLSVSDFNEATKLIDQGSEAAALSFLSRSLINAPDNESATARLVSVLLQRNWILPRWVPFKHDAAVVDASFSPDGKRLVTAAGFMGRLWDLETGKAIELKHRKNVKDIHFSPNGKWVATSSEDYTAHLWDAVDGKSISDSLKHDNFVTALSFSPGNKYLATVSSDKKARLWEAATGKSVGDPLLHEGVVNSVNFSRDEKLLITTSGNAALLWELPAGKPFGEPLKHEAAVSYADFSPDGKWVVTSSGDKTAQVWETATGKKVGQPLAHKDWVNSALFSPDGRLVLTASRDKTARVWEAATGNPVSDLMKHEAQVNAAVFSPNGRWLVTASDDKTARVWDATTGKPLTEKMQHEGEIKAAAFRADGKAIVTASTDRTARVWEIFNGKPVMESIRHDTDKRLNYASFSPDGKLVVTASDDLTARIWETSTGKSVTEPLKHDKEVTLASFSTDGKRLLTAAGSSARIWEVATGRLVETLKHDTRVYSAAFSPDGKWIVTAENLTARVWDASTGKLVTDKLKHKRAVRSAAFSLDGKSVVTASADQTARVWDAATGNPVGSPFEHTSKQTSDELTSAEFSPDGQHVVTSSQDKTARLWQVSTGKQITDEPLLHDKAVNSASFSPNGKYVVTASEDGKTRVWNAATGELVALPFGNEEAVKSAVFGPGGQFVLTRTSGKAARLWVALSGKEVTDPLLHDATVRSAQFSADGKFVVTASDDKTARIWLVSPRGEAPVWLRGLAELVGGHKLGESGGEEALPDLAQTFQEMRTTLAALPDDGNFVRLGRWFVGDPSTRTIAPFANVTMASYIARRVDEGGTNNLHEVLALQPNHALALAKLAKLANQPEQADFLSSRAATYEPGNTEVLWVRSQILLKQLKTPEALVVMEKAIAQDPKGVTKFGPEGAEFTQKNKEGGVSKGWLPKGWDDGNAAAPVNVMYSKLTDLPPAAAAGVGITVGPSAARGAQIRGPRCLGKISSKQVVEGWVRSVKKSNLTVTVQQFGEPDRSEPYKKFVDNKSVPTTPEWKPFKVPFTAAEDFAAELLLTVPSDGSVDIAGVIVHAE